MSDEPFGRQPKPVTITLKGDKIDTEYWLNEFMRRAEFKGDVAKRFALSDSETSFTIYPRAVNE